MSDIRHRQIGQLQKLNETMRTLASQAENHLTVIGQKADPYTDDVTNLDTASIRQAAIDLDQTVRELRVIKEKAQKLNEHLYG